MVAESTSMTRARQLAAIEAVSREQDALRDRGVQQTYSQAELGRRLGLSRARVEQLETFAKLRLLKGLALRSGQDFLDLGGNYAQLAFLRRTTINTTNARRLWRRWCDLAD